MPMSTLARTCSIACALEDARVKNDKKFKRETRERKKALKTISDYTKEAQFAFNRYIRQRDLRLPCISCGRHHNGQWHAGHFRTTAAAPQLRFDERNCHKQCAPCNNHKSGDVTNYRLALIDRLGEREVVSLENNNESKKWTKEELIAIKEKYNKKYKELL